MSSGFLIQIGLDSLHNSEDQVVLSTFLALGFFSSQYLKKENYINKFLKFRTLDNALPWIASLLLLKVILGFWNLPFKDASTEKSEYDESEDEPTEEDVVAPVQTEPQITAPAEELIDPDITPSCSCNRLWRSSGCNRSSRS